MEYYLTVRVLHGGAAVLLMLGLLVHGVMLWRARNARGCFAAQAAAYRQISLPLFALLWLSLPVSGWWLAHWATLPLGQKWLLISILLLPLYVPFGFLLAGNLGRWQNVLAKEAGQPQTADICAGLATGFVDIVAGYHSIDGGQAGLQRCYSHRYRMSCRDLPGSPHEPVAMPATLCGAVPCHNAVRTRAAPCFAAWAIRT